MLGQINPLPSLCHVQKCGVWRNQWCIGGDGGNAFSPRFEGVLIGVPTHPDFNFRKSNCKYIVHSKSGILGKIHAATMLHEIS